MIRILNIQFGEYTKVTYMKHNGRCDETYQLTVGTSENKIIMEFLKEVVMFVKGERAQGKLFENTEIEEAIDAIDADDSHVFHVNDLQAKGVTQ